MTLSASTISGASYNWTGPASTSASTQNYTIANPGVNHSGDYIVTATVGSCVYKDTVTVNMDLTAFNPLTSTNQPLCVGDTLKLDAFWNFGIGMTVFWWGPNNYVDTSYGLSIKTNAQLSDTGMYYVAIRHFPNSGCFSDTIKVHVDSISAKPAKPVASNNSPICSLTDTLRLFASSATPGVFYKWSTTAFSGFNSSLQNPVIYTPTPNDNGIYTVRAYFKGCGSDTASTSVRVDPSMAPRAFIFGDSTIGPWASTYFITFVTDEGINPQYQWYKNGVPIPGATSDTYSGTMNLDFDAGDKICFKVKASPTCASIDTCITCITMGLDMAVNSLEKQTPVIYPNPNSGKFFIDVLDKGTIEIRNTLGQVIFRYIVKQGKNEINAGDLPEGAYVLSLRSGSEVRTSSLIIRH